MWYITFFERPVYVLFFPSLSCLSLSVFLCVSVCVCVSLCVSPSFPLPVCLSFSFLMFLCLSVSLSVSLSASLCVSKQVKNYITVTYTHRFSVFLEELQLLAKHYITVTYTHRFSVFLEELQLLAKHYITVTYTHRFSVFLEELQLLAMQCDVHMCMYWYLHLILATSHRDTGIVDNQIFMFASVKCDPWSGYARLLLGLGFDLPFNSSSF